MDSHCHMYLLSFVLIGAVFGQEQGKMLENVTYKNGGWMGLSSGGDNSEGAENSSRVSGFVDTYQISKNSDAKSQLYSKEWNVFGLTAMDSKKNANILKILLETLSLKKFKFDTIVLHGFTETLWKTGPIFNENYPPLVITSDTVHWKIKDVFNSKILNIVCLGANHSTNHQLLRQLDRTLNGNYLSKLIFVKEFFDFNGTEYVHARNLFDWLHANGLWQSLLMDFSGNSLTLQHLTGKFVFNLALDDFLLQTNNWHDLRGFPVRCSMASNPPRVFLKYDSEHKATLKGTFGYIISLFLQRYNASLKPLILSNLDYYKDFDCLKNLAANKIEICADALPLNEQYKVTNPTELVSGLLLVPYNTPLPRFYYFLKPFQRSVWTLATCSFLYKFITLSFIHRLQHGSWNGSLQIVYATLSILYLPFQLNHIKGYYRRLLEILLILAGFVVANWYLSVLSSLLFTRLYSDDIESVQDLVDRNIFIMVDEFERYVLNRSKVDAVVLSQLKVVSGEVLLQHRRNLDPSNAYYSQFDIISFFLNQQKFLLRPRMKTLKKPVNVVMGGIPMRHNWPFQHLVNGFIRRLIEMGIMRHTYHNTMDEGISSGYLSYFPTEYHSVEPLSIEYFQMPAMLLTVGCILAFISFILEYILHKYINI